MIEKQLIHYFGIQRKAHLKELALMVESEEEWGQLMAFFQQLEPVTLHFVPMADRHGNKERITWKWIFDFNGEKKTVYAREFDNESFNWKTSLVSEGTHISFNTLLEEIIKLSGGKEGIQPRGNRLHQFLFKRFLIMQGVKKLQQVFSANWETEQMRMVNRNGNPSLYIKGSLPNGILEYRISSHHSKWGLILESDKNYISNLAVVNQKIYRGMEKELEEIGFVVGEKDLGEVLQLAFVREICEQFSRTNEFKLKKTFAPNEIL